MRRIRELQGDREATGAVANAMSEILRDWAKTEPEVAWREALALPAEEGEGRTREQAMDAVVREHTARNPDEMLAWIKALPDETKRGRLETVYVSSLVEAGKARQAREYALAMPEGAPRQNAIGALADALFQKDSKSAKAFVADLPDADWRDPTKLRHVFERWVDTDPEPERAIDVFLRRFPADAPSGPAQDAAYDDMFDVFAANHPREASEFFLKLPDRIGSKLLEMGIRDFCEVSREPERGMVL